MSKIYDALKKSEGERRRQPPPGEKPPEQPPAEPPPPTPPPPEPPSGTGERGRPATVTLPPLDRYPERFWQSVTRLAAAIQGGSEGGKRAILFVGAEPDSGTSTLALATSSLLVRDPGVSVLLVDAHSRESASTLLPPAPLGLIQYATGQATPAQILVTTDQRGLTYLPRGAGSYNGPKLFEKLAPFLVSLRTHYDYVILDAAPVVVAPESARLAGVCDGVVVVLASERTPKIEAIRTKEILDEHGAAILGTIINRARRSALFGNR